MKAAERSELGSKRKSPVSVWSTWFEGQALGSTSGGAMSPNPMRRSHPVGLQVYPLSFLFCLKCESCLTSSIPNASEPPSLWRGQRPLGDTEGFTVGDLTRMSPRNLPSGPKLQALLSAVCQALLQRVPCSVACFQAMGRREGLCLAPPPSSVCQHLHFQSVLSSNGTVYTVASDTPFHLPCRSSC